MAQQSETTGIVVIGAGGHGKVIADILRAAGHSVAGFLDDDEALWGAEWCGVAVLGPIASWQRWQPAGLILGIGHNATRYRISQQLADGGHVPWINAVHPRATVAESAQLGSGVAIAAGAIVNPDARLGDHSIVNTAATVDHDCVLGAATHLGPGVHLAGGVQVGRGTLLGVGSVVIPYQMVGAWSIVGAGAVVTTDLPPNCTAVGAPARVIKEHPVGWQQR